MITCFHGDVTLKGDNLDVISDYICITRSMMKVLSDTVEAKQITQEEKMACELMSVLGTAFDDSKLSNRKSFYEVIEMIARYEKEGKKHE